MHPDFKSNLITHIFRKFGVSWTTGSDVIFTFVRDTPRVLCSFEPNACLSVRLFHSLYCVFIIRGGVEDTRLEAKAKDTKKIRGQGQGQPFRGQTLSRPRTGMLEAKAKDQGHKAQVLSKKKKKKKVLTKIFQAISKKKKKEKKKGLHKNFSSDLH